MQPTFAELGVPTALADALASNGMTQAFEVQAATIPDALAGRDICGRAPTGSGKTIAFGVPVLARVPKATAKKPTALILSPTRELADQIANELVPVARAAGRWVTAVYGGVGYGSQINALRKGVDVLVACPGRLIDLIDGGNVSLDDVQIVVVDEADRMADMGFLPDVKRLLDRTRGDRQTLLFSATLDGDIAQLTERYQRDPARHEIGEAEPDVHAMTHHFWKIQHQDRVDHARDAIVAAGPTIVFTRTRHGADRLSGQLDKAGVRAVAIHGGRNQNQRTRALESFVRGEAQALIATDVAARGIHVDGVECVVHFDPPEDGKAYLHRSGRTARAGAEGVVVSFVRPNNRKAVKELQRDLGLTVGIDDPDASALGDGTKHRRAERVDRGRTGSPKRQRTRSDRSRDERAGDERGRTQRPKRRNANLYAEDDPRRTAWEAENGHRIRDWEAHKAARRDSAPPRRDNRPKRRNANLYTDDDPRREARRDPAPKRRTKPPASRGGSEHGGPESGGAKSGGKVHRKGGGAKKQSRETRQSR